MEEQPNTNRIRSNKKRGVLIAVFGLVFLVLAIWGVNSLVFKDEHPANKPGTPEPTIATVRIVQNSFEPSSILVKQGTRITWINEDSALHQIASNPYPTNTGLPGLKSEILNNAHTYTYVADTIGTFGYHDQLIPTINGSIVVEKR